MKYNSINSKEMSKDELVAICGELQIAKNCSQPTITVETKQNTTITVSVDKLKEYQGVFRTITGALKL